MAQHTTVLLEEAIEALQIHPDGTYVDCTFGRGGHTRAILDRLGPHGRLIALDRDIDAIAEGKKIADNRLQLFHACFSRLKDILNSLSATPINGVLLDLGVSSPQLEEASRGFSFRSKGPLDMRMDRSAGMTAQQWLAAVDEAELASVIKTFGEERFAQKIARAIVAARDTDELATTHDLSSLISRTIGKREPGQDPATRTFQAIRIYLNRELEEITAVLPHTLEVLAPRGRLVVISFHSLEDRIVKQFMRSQASGDIFPSKLPIRALDLAQPKLTLVGKAIRPSAAEIAKNPRARSAVMRVAERTEAAL